MFLDNCGKNDFIFFYLLVHFPCDMELRFNTRNRVHIFFSRGSLTKELRVASYELRVTIYCTSYELLFIYESRVTTYCMSYELLFTYELRVTIYCTSYDLLFTYELRVTIYCASYELIFTYELRVTIYCTSYKLN